MECLPQIDALNVEPCRRVSFKDTLGKHHPSPMHVRKMVTGPMSHAGRGDGMYQVVV